MLESQLSEPVRTVLLQIAEMVEALLEEDQLAAIDVEQLPLNQQEFDELWHNLGEGNVQAVVADETVIQVTGTGISGVWRVRHYNTDDELLGEFIEVSYCPDILVSATGDVRDSLQMLRARLFASHYQHE